MHIISYHCNDLHYIVVKQMMRNMKRNYLLLATVMVAITGCAGPRLAITFAGENLQALTQVTDAQEPCITPFGGDEGKNLYFAAREKGKYYNIYLKENPFSSAMTQKTSGMNLNYSPTFSEALGRIAFRCQNEGSSTSDIFTMPASGGKALTQITESTSSFENNPCFTKDGKLLVYDKQDYTYARLISVSYLLGLVTTNTAIIEHSEIWIKNLETGESILLGNGYEPSFSPDGKKIAYVKYSSDAKSCSIWIMDIDGSNQSQITDAKKGFAYHPKWSPDGKRIVFQATKKDKKDADIYVVNVDGTDSIQLTINKSFDGMPYWTTDDYIYFVSDRGNKKGNYQIWRFKLVI